MALVSLSPWPTEDADVLAAIACLKTVLPGNLTDDRIERLGQMAADRVERYAKHAPANTKSVAVEMFCGYVSQSNTGPVQQDGPHQDQHRAPDKCTPRPGIICPVQPGLLSEWKTRNAA